MYMIWRSYNECSEPENDKIIKKGIIYAKKVVVGYYANIGRNRSQEIRVFIDNEQRNMIDELNYVFEFYYNKDYIGKNLTEEDFHFIDDRILSAVKVYRMHLKKDKGDLVSEELEEEIKNINKLLKKYMIKGGNYDLYTELYFS